MESLCDPIRQEFKNWLLELGVQQFDEVDEDEAAKLERELKKMIDDIPELEKFFGFRSPKQVLSKNNDGLVKAVLQSGSQSTIPIGSGQQEGRVSTLDIGDENGNALNRNEEKGGIKANPISRMAKRGPKITFANIPNRVELGWTEGNTVFINSGHSCYNKTKGKGIARKLHNFYAIATAVQRFLNEGEDNPDFRFVDRMMRAWGEK